MVGFAAIAAYGITMFSFFQLDGRGPKSSSDGATIVQMSHEPARDARQRLVVEDQQAFANEPILLAVVAVPITSSGSLSLRGLAHGTRLSAGAALDEDGWELSLRDIGSAYVYAPPDFVGVMNGTIALLSSSNEVIDSRPIRLEWIAKANSPQPPSKREIDSEPSRPLPNRRSTRNRRAPLPNRRSIRNRRALLPNRRSIRNRRAPLPNRRSIRNRRALLPNRRSIRNRRAPLPNR